MRAPFGGINVATAMTGTVKRLLVSENDPEVGDLLRLIFEDAGFSAALVRNGEPLPWARRRIS